MNSFQKISRNKFVRSVKAISPIFATLILIAIAVIAGIVVYMFTSGAISTLTGGGTSGQEKVAIQSAQGSTTSVTIYAQSTGGPKPAISGLTIQIKDSGGNIVDTLTATDLTTGAWDNGALVAITATPTAGALTVGNSYTATLITPAGGSFVSPSFSVTS